MVRLEEKKNSVAPAQPQKTEGKSKKPKPSENQR